MHLDDPMVSAQHAEISRQPDGSYRTRDLGSHRGIRVGKAYVADAVLCDADELMIGPAHMRFEDHDTDQDDREELLRLRALNALSRDLAIERDLDRLLDRVLATCFQLVRADRAMIVVYAARPGAPFAARARTRDGRAVAAPSTTLVSQMMATREPYLRTEVDRDGVRSLLDVPLQDGTEGQLLGVLRVESMVSGVFGPNEVELVSTIAGHSILAIHDALVVRELENVRVHESRRLERVLRGLPVGVIVLDDAQRCVLVNEWMRERADLLGACHAGDLVEAIGGVACNRLVADRRVQTAAGSPERRFTITAQSGDDAETVIVVHDVTEDLAQLATAAHRERLMLLGQLAGGVAHDFNNLLCVILNFAMIIEESVESAEIREDAAAISQAARSATDLVRQLLAFSRREDVRLQVVPVADLITRMRPMLKRAVGDRVKLAIEVADDVPHVRLAPSQLEQIVLNLVVNARDAMPDGGRVLVRASAAGAFACIEVTDTGIGMSPDVVRRIFEPYFTTKERGQGTGLGLATVHGIVQHAGGDVSVKSVEGNGTTFRITLPKNEGAAADQALMRIVHAGQAKLLVVDDDPGVRRIAERILCRAGYDVVTASGGAEALLLANDRTIDLMLTDMVMPGMAGRELAGEAQRARPDLKVMFMSGYHGGEPVPDEQFVAKPFSRDDMLRRIADALALNDDGDDEGAAVMLEERAS